MVRTAAPGWPGWAVSGAETSVDSWTLSAARDALAVHPAVARVDLHVHGERLLAVVEPSAHYARQLTFDDDRQVDDWQRLYDWIYHQTTDPAPLGEQFAGWVSSYTGRPIDVAQMREWRDAAADRVLALRPSRVLDIGVGLGLLLAPIAPRCIEYWGTDFSPDAIAALGCQLADHNELNGKVKLSVQRADDTAGLPAEHFDVVILNSVAQYFPSGSYLATVVARAMTLLRRGGTLYLGDVRNLRSLRAFRTAVLAKDFTDSAQGRELVDQALLLEKELVVDPDFFAAVARRLPDIAAVELHVKRGTGANELNRHRYDVLLHRAPGPPVTAAAVLSWGSSLAGALPALIDHLTQHRPRRIRVTGIPDTRIWPEVAAAHALWSGASPAAVRAVLADPAPDAVDPEDLHRVGVQLGCRVAVTVSSTGKAGTVDAIFADTAEVDPYLASGPVDLPLAAYVSAPSRGALLDYVAVLRDLLKKQLPDAAAPEFVVLRPDPQPMTSPATANGEYR
jgi:SAM-dependent methyltransferase